MLCVVARICDLWTGLERRAAGILCTCSSYKPVSFWIGRRGLVDGLAMLSSGNSAYPSVTAFIALGAPKLRPGPGYCTGVRPCMQKR